MEKAIASLKRKIAGFNYVCSGTLLRRSLVCGKGNCRCKAQKPSLHGPYYYWSRRLEGRQVSKVLSQGQAKIVEQAIKNYKKALQLLRQWEARTIKAIDHQQPKDTRR